MSKQVQVNLAFNADTSKAKSQINDLINSLNKISTQESWSFDDKNLRDASNAAKDLTTHLQNAVNVDTGKLDLNKFTQSLSASNQTLDDLYVNLSKAGPQGQQAFLQLASSIASSESQVLSLSSKVKDLGQTLKNTIKWQLSSSLVHGFMSAMSSAVGYAKDLNSSLNDIRIVTGASTDEMARFAEQANKSAKALSSTTTEYTKASLIYYQQGLSDAEVQERTEVTIKMANVSKESAQTVSDQMTAVWNNFYDGSKSLEYYADVMTALGAATASSVDEIAGGLEKFAAIGDTIGLSYEYAASALATITSNTRQSEEVVGTALKTIFARIQGLNLGETLDDGTTLNKYSEALEKVGISIFDQAGEIKNMDSILDEMGNKWQTLSKDQQIALAQTVAGTRQYTQLVALMDNWNNGDNDSFQANLNTAYNSSGALDEQQEIYAESWEAAADRVKAATEDIYDSLINDEAIIVLLNGLESILTLVGNLIDGFGGLKSILLMVASVFTKSIANEMPDAINKLKSNIDVITGETEKKKQENVNKAKGIIDKNIESGKYGQEGSGSYIRAKATSEELSSLSELEKMRSRLSTAQQENISKRIAEKKSIQESIAALEDEKATIEKSFEATKRKSTSKSASAYEIDENGEKKKKKKKDTKVGELIGDENWNNIKTDAINLKQNKAESDLTIQEKEIIASYERIKAARDALLSDNTEEAFLIDGISKDDNIEVALQTILEKLKEAYTAQTQLNIANDEYSSQITSWQGTLDSLDLIDDIDKQEQALEEVKIAMKSYLEYLKSIGVIKLDNLTEQFEKIDSATIENAESIKELINTFKNLKVGTTDGETLSATMTELGKEIETAEVNVKQLEDALKGLTGSDKAFEELSAAAGEAGTKIATTTYKAKQLGNSLEMKPKMDASGVEMELSTALTRVGSGVMEVMSLFTVFGSTVSTVFDESATAGEKFIAVISMIGSVAMSLGDITELIKDWPDIMEALSGPAGKVGNAFSTLGNSVSGLLSKLPLVGTFFSGLIGTTGSLVVGVLAVVAAIAALVAIIALCVKGYQEWKANTPEGKLEAAKETTEAMTTAAEDANTAYQNLLNTLSGYNSAVDALGGLEVGTQEFTNALIAANEKAWELIDTYGLIQGQDWEYGENGEIIIKQSAQDRITKEANNIREDAIVAQSVAEVQEKEAAYNLAKDEAGYWGNNLTEDTRQGLYDALGFTDGSADSLFNRWQEASNAGDDSQIIDEIGKKYWEDEWDNTDADMVDFIRSSIANMEKIGNMFDAYRDYNLAKENQFEKQASTVMGDEEAYQRTSWKGAINDYLESEYENTKNQAMSKWDDQGDDAKSDAEVESAYQDYLKQTYIEEDGKYYRKDAQGNKTGEAVEGLTDLSVEAQREVLATIDAWKILEEKGVDMAEGFNQIASKMTDTEKEVADALLNGDLSGLTEEQIAEMSGMSADEIKAAYPFINQLEVLGIDIDSLLNDLTKNLADWKPPELDLEQWKSDYSSKMDILNDLETGDTIDASEYALLGDAAEGYFSEQLDGTYKLIGSAKELKEVIESISIDELKDDINTKKNTISTMNELDIVTDSGRTLDFNAAHNAAVQGTLHETWSDAYIKAINEALETNYSTVEECATAWENYESSLLESSSTLAMAIDNYADLEEVFSEGVLSVEDYNKKLEELNNTLDADVDAEQYENLTEVIQTMAEASDDNNEGALEFSENLKDNEKAAKKVAQAILRYDSAVEDVKKNSKDWMKILKSGNLQDMADIMDDLENSYNDLLDLDGEVLSDDFITNTENLELMTKAANGSTEAYEELARRAAEDIIAQCRLEADFDTEAFDAALTNFQNQIAGINLPDLEVGCDLMGEEAFIAACNEIINAAGMTASQAQAYLGSMGVDAEVVAEPETTTDTTTTVSMIPNEVSLSGTAMNPITGLSAPYFFPGVDYSLVPETQTTTKETTAVALKVKSATKASGGAIKHANSSNGSGSKSSSSGGGGGGSKNTPKYAEKKNDSDKTRYHTLQNQLEDLTAEYDELADAADRAFGQDKLDAIDAEIAKTDELIDKQEEYLQAIQSDLPVDKSIMTAYYDDVIGGPSIQFDENGNISNYDQIQDAMFAKYNAMTAYDEDSTEWQVFEEKYEQLEKYIEQYEETYDLLRDEEATYQELLNQRADLELEKVEYRVEVELAVPEDNIEVIEYQLGRIEDDAKKTGEALALLTQQAEETYDQILINKQGLNDALKLSLSTQEITEILAGNMDVLNGKNFTENQIEAIRDYKDNLLELNEEFDDIREQIEETVLDTFDELHGKLEDGIEQFDYYGAVLESYKEIIETVGKDSLGISDAMVKTLSQASIDNAINQVEASKDAYDALKQAQLDAEGELEKAKARGDEQSMTFWEDTLNEIQQNAQDAQEEMLDAWQEVLNKMTEQFEAAVQTAVDAFNEAVFQLGGIEGLSEEFDKQQEMAEMYLDDYQKIYELSKLNRDINNSIDDTDSLAGKQKLKKLLGEINELQADGVQMSQYDLEYLQAEYDLRLAEIALEEAQRAKDTVRLSRDNEGNWSYVYTQNTDAVDEAQQKYEDALYSMQDLSSNYIDEMSERLIETSQEMQEALAAVRIEDYASIDEYYEECERIQEQYQEQLALQEEELQKAVDNNKELYDTDWTNYHNATGYKISDTELFATKFSDTLLGSLMDSESDTANFTNILADATTTLMGELYSAAEQYYTNMAAAMEAAGTTTGTFAEDLATNVDQIKQDSEEAATAVEDMAENMQEQMDNIINKVGEWQRTYGEAMNEIINANLKVIESFNEMLATLSMDNSTVTVTYDIQNANDDILNAEQFATGGYTGSWGNTGKFAVLDEKELILNKDDTANFLDALKISRSMLNTIELNARQASLGLGAMIPATIKDDIKETLEQVVQITAEFPNATNHNEIEEAFNTLINRASQYANRK